MNNPRDKIINDFLLDINDIIYVLNVEQDRIAKEIDKINEEIQPLIDKKDKTSEETIEFAKKTILLTSLASEGVGMNRTATYFKAAIAILTKDIISQIGQERGFSPQAFMEKIDQAKSPSEAIKLAEEFAAEYSDTSKDKDKLN